MKTLVICGSYKGISGHDRHVRAFVRELCNQGISVKLADFPYWSPGKLPKELRDPWFETLNKPLDSRVALHFCMPHQVQVARGLLNVNFTMFEATRVPRKWVKLNRRHDLVVLPTASSQCAWVESGFPQERTALCALGVDVDLFHPEGEPLLLIDDRGRKVAEYGARFLNVSDVMPRKNLLGLLRVWISATHRQDDAILIMKFNCGSDEWLQIFMRSIETLEAHLGKSRKQSAPVLFMINRLFSDADMPKLYRAATHYWSMSYGEGWDQPMMEAAATGLRLIAPNHTAYTAYLDGSVASMIPARRVPANFRWSDGTHKLFRGADWWQPDEDAAAEYVRHAIDHPPSGPNLGLRTRIGRSYTWRRATSRLVEILSNLESTSASAHHRRKWFGFLRE
jgi:glycosyltransferase involved in cell wall biosynthesis